jgi:hypothetical protein
MTDHKHYTLTPVLLTGHDPHKSSTAILAARLRDTPQFDFKLHKSLQWWFKVDKHAAANHEEHAWQRIPHDALIPLEEDQRVVRLNAAHLGRPEQGACSFSIGVTTDLDAEPQDDNAAHIEVNALVPVTPFRIDGHGTDTHQRTSAVEVSMSRTKVPPTKDEILWVVIRNSANSLGFNAYQDFMDRFFVEMRSGGRDKRLGLGTQDALHLEPYVLSSVDAYKVAKAATELFVMTRCGVVRQRTLQPDPLEEEGRFGHRLPQEFEKLWESYLEPIDTAEGGPALILPYLGLIRRKLGDIGASRAGFGNLLDAQAGLLQDKLAHPVLLELIWSYWMEEGMLVQAFNAVTRRFQNHRSNGERDPLAQLELDPLRPVNNLLWGWVQDETSSLSVLRRAHEYEHQYGFTLHGKAVAELRAADRRSKFLESFHNLLWRCMQFYRQDDDTTVIADGFGVLNALKETHYLLAQGAHNQFGNLPSTARQEMLMQQWMLSRPEVREFLGTRVMVPYPEPWMDRVDAVKTLKGWTDTSVVHFRDLAVFGEQLLLSIRWGAWSTLNDPHHAANWARYWRPEVQGYIHGYRAVTSVDLTADVTDSRQAETRFLPPSVHLRNRLLAQAQPAR